MPGLPVSLCAAVSPVELGGDGGGPSGPAQDRNDDSELTSGVLSRLPRPAVRHLTSATV